MKIIKSSVLFFNFFVLLILLSCKKNDTALLRQQMQALKGEWVAERVYVDIDSPDREASLKIQNSMKSDMVIIKRHLLFNEDGSFMTYTKIDSVVIQSEGFYTLDIENQQINFEFKQGDSNPISFDFQYKIDKDSLYIINDNLQKIRDNVDENNFSDTNLRLLYGIKDRDKFELNSASITKVFARPNVNDTVEDNELEITEEVKSNNTKMSREDEEKNIPSENQENRKPQEMIRSEDETTDNVEIS